MTTPKAETRVTIANAALRVLAKHGLDGVVWGDCSVLDEIGSIAKMKRTHPLNRHARILDALGRSSLFDRTYIRYERRVRYMKLNQRGVAARDSLGIRCEISCLCLPGAMCSRCESRLSTPEPSDVR